MAEQEKDVLVVPSGRHGLPRGVVAEHQRERLLAATISLVAKRGYRGTSVDHMVKAAKVGQVAFYELFDGKENCFLAAYERIVEETRAELAVAVSPEAPWPDRICAWLTRLAELIGAEPARARVGLVEVQAAGTNAFARYQEATDAAIPILREGRTYPAEPVVLSETLEEATIGAVAWILQQRLVRGEAAETGQLAGESIRITLGPYLGEAEAQHLAAAAERQLLGKA